MGRLTYLQNGRPCVLVNGTEVFGPVAERLHAYEETGYEPGGVHDLSDRCAKMALERGQQQLEVALDALSPEDRHELEHDTYGPLHRKIGTWMKADSEGRLLVLPCKVGDELWFEKNGKIQCETIDRIAAEQTDEDDDWCISIYTMSVSVLSEDIGRLVFLTREAAEAALKGASNGNT